jgi:hypothetical protein
MRTNNNSFIDIDVKKIVEKFSFLTKEDVTVENKIALELTFLNEREREKMLEILKKDKKLREEQAEKTL